VNGNNLFVGILVLTIYTKYDTNIQVLSFTQKFH